MFRLSRIVTAACADQVSSPRAMPKKFEFRAGRYRRVAVVDLREHCRGEGPAPGPGPRAVVADRGGVLRLGAVAVAGGAVGRVRQPCVLEHALDERYGKLYAEPFEVARRPAQPHGFTTKRLIASARDFAGGICPNQGAVVLLGHVVWSGSQTRTLSAKVGSALLRKRPQQYAGRADRVVSGLSGHRTGVVGPGLFHPDEGGAG